MKGLIQRVSEAAVTVHGEVVGEISQGLLLLLGVEKGDTEEQAERLLHKVLSYRIFSDEEGKMNRSVADLNAGLLIVSQFTLAADTRKGLRPSFSSAEMPARAEALYQYFVTRARDQHLDVATGVFGADMKVRLVNDGPVTFMLQV